MAIEIVDLPIESEWFSIVMLVYQRVVSPKESPVSPRFQLRWHQGAEPDQPSSKGRTAKAGVVFRGVRRFGTIETREKDGKMAISIGKKSKIISHPFLFSGTEVDFK